MRLFNENKIYDTQKGDKVRSISEQLIANYLFDKWISYKYEFSLCWLLPDFYLDEIDVILEFWGDPQWIKFENYNKSMKKKMAIYYKNNQKFISIYPDNLWKEWKPNISKFEWILNKRLEQIDMSLSVNKIKEISSPTKPIIPVIQNSKYIEKNHSAQKEIIREVVWYCILAFLSRFLIGLIYLLYF